MSKQQIHMVVTVDGEAFTKSMDTIDEFSDTINQVKKEHPEFDPKTGVMVIVGELRCLKEIPGKATMRYGLTNAGCGC